jgi:nucleotide-binding universal stress UspA family protein
MYPFKNILFCTDFSPLSRSMLKYAAAFARHNEARLFIHNAQSATLPPQALRLSERALAEHGFEWLVGIRQELEELATHDLVKGLDVRVLLTEGEPESEIPRIVQENGIDLVTIATQRIGKFGRPLLGSTATAVLERVHCAALVGRQPTHDFVYYKGSETTIALNRIVFATDFKEYDAPARKIALEMAKTHGAKVTAVHALGAFLNYVHSVALSDAHGMESLVREGALEKLAKLKDEAPGVEVETVVAEGRAYEEVLRIASEQETDLVVMGIGARKTGNVIGHNAERVIREMPCPVLVVPSGE